MTENIPEPRNPIPSQPPISPLEAACQWFLGENKFCDKVKKEVRCDGNVGNCPFCK